VRLARDDQGQLQWSWRRDGEPLTGAAERALVKNGRIKQSEARFNPVDVETGKPINFHFGSVCWNAYRKKWVAIGLQSGARTSVLGEVFYSEADDPAGPWQRARKIVTHNRYSFYNPVQHEFFDEEGGWIIYFEGTYSETFSGNPFPTPRYDYNQIMYRLDLSDPRLRL